MEIIKKRVKQRDEIIERASRWVKSIPYKATALLIGSYARGDFNLWSDVDVLLIADFKGCPIERLKRLDVPPGFQAIPLTVEEFVRLMKKGDPIAIEAVNAAIVLRDDLKLTVETMARSHLKCGP